MCFWPGGGGAYRREEGPVVDLAAGAAAGVLSELLDDRAEDRLRRQEAGSPERPLHAGLGDVTDVEVVIVREEGGKAQALLVDLFARASPPAKTASLRRVCLNAGWPTGRLEVRAPFPQLPAPMMARPWYATSLA